MKEFVEINILKKIPKSITCNKCGKTGHLLGSDLERELLGNEYQHIKFSFGYGSKFNEQIWELDLCENCLEEFIATFKHSPEVSEY
jgi:hypothetical protein